MGLLDALNSPDSAFAMGLLDAAGPSRMPVSIGQALNAGYGQFQKASRSQWERDQAEARAKLEEERQRRMLEAHQMEVEKIRQAQADEQRLREFSQQMHRFVQTPQQQALANGEGPTPANAAMIPLMQPQIDRKGMYGAMMQSGVPSLMSAGMAGFGSLDDKEAAAAERRTALSDQLAARRQAIEEANAAKIEAARIGAESRRDIASMMAASRSGSQGAGGKPPVGFRYKPDGDLEAIPGGPADLKAQAASQRQADGATDVDVALGTLRDAYNRLESGGGITSTKQGGSANLAASASSSTMGQAFGKAFGTKNQSARNDIAMSRPALLAALMKATGMSAKQMDSNAELKLWLSTATDPTLDVEANRRALDNIERKFLSGNGKQTQSTGRKAVRTGIYGGRRVIQYDDGTTDYAD